MYHANTFPSTHPHTHTVNNVGQQTIRAVFPCSLSCNVPFIKPTHSLLPKQYAMHFKMHISTSSHTHTLYRCLLCLCTRVLCVVRVRITSALILLSVMASMISCKHLAHSPASSKKSILIAINIMTANEHLGLRALRSHPNLL